MNTLAALGRLNAAGIHLRAEGNKLIAAPREKLTDELRDIIRTHKDALLNEVLSPSGVTALASLRGAGNDAQSVAAIAALMSDPAPRSSKEEELASDPDGNSRRDRALAQLTMNPALHLAVVCDGEGDPMPVAVAIRDKGTCEIEIPAARFDPFALIELVRQHGGSI